jgi:hypothetical protein
MFEDGLIAQEGGIDEWGQVDVLLVTKVKLPPNA